ncbi:hypothetical protein SORBI_3005G045400 [Sorghum bicolor]|uniref:Uncharacterized protein n=1 Tax=Sorghum bicolor TaxID=4558 RepID=A0A1B6PQ48_SORBI|nr:hypothetical protein SORBI_3005G045400 [Sorghum bicolor]
MPGIFTEKRGDLGPHPTKKRGQGHPTSTPSSLQRRFSLSPALFFFLFSGALLSQWRAGWSSRSGTARSDRLLHPAPFCSIRPDPAVCLRR